MAKEKNEQLKKQFELKADDKAQVQGYRVDIMQPAGEVPAESKVKAQDERYRDLMDDIKSVDEHMPKRIESSVKNKLVGQDEPEDDNFNIVNEAWYEDHKNDNKNEADDSDDDDDDDGIVDVVLQKSDVQKSDDRKSEVEEEEHVFLDMDNLSGDELEEVSDNVLEGSQVYEVVDEKKLNQVLGEANEGDEEEYEKLAQKQGLLFEDAIKIDDKLAKEDVVPFTKEDQKAELDARIKGIIEEQTAIEAGVKEKVHKEENTDYLKEFKDAKLLIEEADRLEEERKKKEAEEKKKAAQNPKPPIQVIDDEEDVRDDDEQEELEIRRVERRKGKDVEENNRLIHNDKGVEELKARGLYIESDLKMAGAASWGMVRFLVENPIRLALNAIAFPAWCLNESIRKIQKKTGHRPNRHLKFPKMHRYKTYLEKNCRWITGSTSYYREHWYDRFFKNYSTDKDIRRRADFDYELAIGVEDDLDDEIVADEKDVLPTEARTEEYYEKYMARHKKLVDKSDNADEDDEDDDYSPKESAAEYANRLRRNYLENARKEKERKEKEENWQRRLAASKRRVTEVKKKGEKEDQSVYAQSLSGSKEDELFFDAIYEKRAVSLNRVNTLVGRLDRMKKAYKDQIDKLKVVKNSKEQWGKDHRIEAISNHIKELERSENKRIKALKKDIVNEMKEVKLFDFYNAPDYSDLDPTDYSEIRKAGYEEILRKGGYSVGKTRAANEAFMKKLTINDPILKSEKIWRPGVTSEVKEAYNWLACYYAYKENDNDYYDGPEKVLEQKSYHIVLDNARDIADSFEQKTDDNNSFACAGAAMYRQYCAKAGITDRVEEKSVSQYSIKSFKPYYKKYHDSKDALAVYNPDMEEDEYNNLEKTVKESLAGKSEGDLYALGDFFIDKQKDAALHKISLSYPGKEGLDKDQKRLREANYKNLRALFFDKVYEGLSTGNVVTCVMDQPTRRYLVILGIEGNKVKYLDPAETKQGKIKESSVSKFILPKDKAQSVDLVWMSKLERVDGKNEINSLMKQYSDLKYDENDKLINSDPTEEELLTVSQNDGISVTKKPGEMEHNIKGVKESVYFHKDVAKRM